jgi:hypothetical protein
MSAARRFVACASVACFAALPAPRALRAATTRIVTWGDSITYGSHDFPSGQNPNNCWDGFPDNNPPESCGIAVRLENRLDDVAYSNPVWDVQLINLGKGGEETAGALSRICKWVGASPPPPPQQLCSAPCPSPYAGEYQINSLKHWVCNGTVDPEDAFVLMEGTNDTTQNVSVETIRFNLEELSARAIGFGMNVAVASVIPRHPETCSPGNQEEDTQELNAEVLDLATDHAWTFVDAYCRLRRVPGMANNAYQDYCGWKCDGDPNPRPPLCGLGDPCGHPNSTGFDRLVCNNSGCGGGAWSWTSDPACPSLPPPFETVVKTLLPPRLTLTVPGGPLVTGTSYVFSTALHDLAQTDQLTWNFGDGTVVQVTPAATPATRSHTYFVPGPYTVTVTARNPNGAQRSRSQGIVITGPDLTLFRGDFENGDASDWSLTQP